MNNIVQAVRKIESFLQGNKKVLLLTGTHMKRKHVIALASILEYYPSPATILFRANHLRNIGGFLSPILGLSKEPKTGKPLNIRGGYTLYVDTINPRSWNKSPYNIDVALVYPVDSLQHDKGDDCVTDLINRRAKKILLVSWADTVNYSWTNQFSPIQVTYDAEEEDLEMHKRVSALSSDAHPRDVKSSVPEYAESTPEKLRVQINCRSCGSSRWARLNDTYPGKSALRNAPAGQYIATCIMCGTKATDNYNWSR